MIKNDKGFVITEVLILASVLIGVLIFMYSQFKNITRSYEYSFKYDTVEGMYLANNMVNYINEGSYDALVQNLNSQTNKYLDITDCNINYFNTSNYCDMLFEASKVEQVIFTKEDLLELKQNMSGLSEDFKDYINTIKTANSFNDHRIIIKYKDKTFATMRFNRGESYVQNGLIAHLDAINNTGNGHSNDIKEWVDLSGNGNSATLYNNPTVSNNSIIFDGKTNYARIENTAGIAFPYGTTWEARLKVLSLIGLKANGNMNLFGVWETAGGGIFFSNTNVIKVNLYMNGGYISSENTSLNSIGQYYTVTMTYDNTSMKQYINGNLVSMIDLKGQFVPSALPLALGTDQHSSYANVEFQSVRVYNRALTDDEVLRNYQIDMARY